MPACSKLVTPQGKKIRPAMAVDQEQLETGNMTPASAWELLGQFVAFDAAKESRQYVEEFDTRQQGE